MADARNLDFKPKALEFIYFKVRIDVSEKTTITAGNIKR